MLSPASGLPAISRMRGSPCTIVCESPKLFCANVSWSASTRARNVWNPASVASVVNTTLFSPGVSCTDCTPICAPSPKRRTVAGCAMVVEIVTSTWMSSPTRAVAGEWTRWMMVSSAAPRPVTNVSICTPRAAASDASDWPRPVVSLPSVTSTMRFWVSSGNSADASRNAPPMSVALVAGTDAKRSRSVSSVGSRSTRASPPNATTAALSPSGRSSSASRTNARADSRPVTPTESERSTTKTVVRRSTGQTSAKPARASTSEARMVVRRTSETRRRPLARWWRAAKLRPSVTASSSRPTMSSSGRLTVNGRLMPSPFGRRRGARRTDWRAGSRWRCAARRHARRRATR